MRVLMVGATGRHAHWVLRELNQRGVSVRALVRNEPRRRCPQQRRRRGGHRGPHQAGDPFRRGRGDGRCLPHRPGASAGEAEMGVAIVDAAAPPGYENSYSPVSFTRRSRR